MDYHRADWSEFYESDDSVWDREFDVELPAEPIGQEERRMQMRAHAIWSTLRENEAFPPIAALNATDMADFADQAVLLDFSAGIENPAIAFLGAGLAEECGAEAPIRHLSDIPGTSLLSRVAGHYVQILAYQAPIGFQAEFVNRHQRTTLYRGMLLPFGDADGVISHVLGVLNWKELADADMAAALLREVRQAYAPAAIDTSPAPQIDGLLGPLLAAAQPPAEAPSLIDWLVAARSMARVARLRADNSHVALYAAIGAAWDFALATRDEPEEFARLLAGAGLKAQTRAPMLPLIKLVFGPGADKTRLTEYATVLAHAERLDIAPGALAGWLAAVSGGLKAVVQDERHARVTGAGRAPSRHDQLAQRLRRIRTRPLSSLASGGETASSDCEPEFSVVVTRRLPGGEIVVLGEASADDALLARVARHLPG